MIVVLSSLNKLDAVTKVTKRFSNPQALGSALAALGTLQPWAFRLLNRLVFLVLASDYYIVIYVHFIADEKPEMSELHKHLVKYCGLWRAIGLKLGLKDDLLETISRDNSKQQQECFRVTLQKWLIQDVSPNWNTLELAITNAQRDDLSLENLSRSTYLCTYMCTY